MPSVMVKPFIENSLKVVNSIKSIVLQCWSALSLLFHIMEGEELTLIALKTEILNQHLIIRDY